MVLENKKRRQRYEEFLKELRRRFRKGKSRIVIFVSHGYQPYKLRLISRKQSDRKGRLYIEYRSVANGFFVIIWFCRRLFVIDEKRRFCVYKPFPTKKFRISVIFLFFCLHFILFGFKLNK